MHKPMNAPLARYSISIGFPAATLVDRVRMMPMAIAAIAHIGSNLTWRCSIITLMLRSSGNRLDLAIVFAVAVLTNFAYLILSNGDFYYPDSFTYLAPARSMLSGAGFLDDSNLVETIRTPAYPLLLALFGARTLPIIILQHLINVALALGIYIFAASRTANRLIALVASLLFAIDVPTIHYANKLLTETTFAALLYVLFLLALHRPNVVALGLLTGVLVLVRPIAIFFFVPLAIVLAIWHKSARYLATFTLLALLPPVAWAARNKVQTGVFSVSSIGNINLLSQRAAGALAIEDEGDFREALTDEESALTDEADDWIQQTLHIPDAEELPVAVRAKYYAQYGVRVIREHWLSFVQLTIRGVLVNFVDSDWDAVWDISQISPDVLRLTLGLIPVIILAFATVGVIDLWRSDRALALLIIVVVVYFIGISAGGEAESRFRVPVVPQLAIAAGVGVAAVRRGLTSPR